MAPTCAGRAAALPSRRPADSDHTARLRGPALLGALLAAALLGACESTPQVPSQPNDGVSAIQFDDIPVPKGLKLHERLHGSDAVVVGDYRYGNFVYSGPVPIAEAASYLRERMPQHAWELVADETDEQGTTTLQFRRGKYRAECKLGRNADKTATQLTVTVRTTLDDQTP